MPHHSSPPESPRSSPLTIAHLERRREGRELRRVLVTQSLHPGQLALLQRGGARSGGPVRHALADARDVHSAEYLPLKREIEVTEHPVIESAQARAPAPAPAESRSMPWSGDAVAQAQTLRDAARHGVPFCAVCEAARRQRERQGTA